MSEVSACGNVFKFGSKCPVDKYFFDTFCFLQLAIDRVIEASVQARYTCKECGSDDINVLLQFLNISRVETSIRSEITRCWRQGRAWQGHPYVQGRVVKADTRGTLLFRSD